MEPPVASPSPSRAAPTPPAPRRAARTTCPGAAPLATSTLTAGSASARARVSAGARRGWIFIPALQREAVWPARHSPLLWAQFPQLYNEERRGGAQGAINSGECAGLPRTLHRARQRRRQALRVPVHLRGPLLLCLHHGRPLGWQPLVRHHCQLRSGQALWLLPDPRYLPPATSGFSIGPRSGCLSPIGLPLLLRTAMAPPLLTTVLPFDFQLWPLHPCGLALSRVCCLSRGLAGRGPAHQLSLGSAAPPYRPLGFKNGTKNL